jgi:peptide-methionine (S)-S-oxide reductase
MRMSVAAIMSCLLLTFALVGCGQMMSTSHAADVKDLPAPAVDLPAPSDGKPQTVVLAMGCFWCSEAVFEQLNGVTDVTAGYAGGTKETADYGKVSNRETDHAESVRITYDPAKISYGQLLRVMFTIFDPTTKDRQGPDAGHEYRTAIFYTNDDQRRVAAAYIKQLDDAKIFDAPIVTTLEPLDKGFFPAEDYHQHYVQIHPDEPYVRQQALPKIAKVRAHFKDLVKAQDAAQTSDSWK